jgi:transposase
MENESIWSHILPTDLLKYFEIEKVEELKNAEGKIDIEITLSEMNNIPSGYDKSDYESKGFMASKRIQDFPIRGKAVYLNVKRRRWRHKETKQEIQSDYNFIAEGAKITEELSDFLKGTGRDPRRYN